MKNAKNGLKKCFFFSDTGCLSCICCAAQFPHCDFSLLRGLQKSLKSMKGAKLQYLRVMSLHLHLMSRLVAAVSVCARGEVEQNFSYWFP